jgi:hypothetical protein
MRRARLSLVVVVLAVLELQRHVAGQLHDDVALLLIERSS